VNKKLIIKISEQLLVVSSLQLMLSVYFKSSVTPSFFLIWLFILTWDGNTEIALLLAFLTGIICDVMSRGTLGSTSIRFLLLVYINSFLRIKSLSGRFIGTVLLSFIFFIFILFEPATGFLWNFWPLMKYSAMFALYNGIILFLIELAMRKYRWKWKKDYLGMS